MSKPKNGVFSFLPPACIRPEGWLKRQLQLQADGLAGQLDRVWPDVSDSKWIGGEHEGWERVPYWLDGFIPLAWLLNDDGMKARAKRYVDHILAQQQEDGWICPCSREDRSDYDVWVVFLICKVLALYADFTGDKAAEEAVYRALGQLCLHLNHNPLFNWGHSRWFECYIPILWLMEKHPDEEWLSSLAHKLRMQGMNWRYFYENWQYGTPRPKGEWSYINHVVNVAMSLKAEALIGRLEETPVHKNARHALEMLFRDHGMAAWHFTGDECLAGLSPIQGSELCSVAEAMYSYEHLICFTGESCWSDLLERVAYNTLPATISPDMWTHQYDQMTNQVRCVPFAAKQQPFLTNSEESHIFGLEPNYGCCTANMGQAWPKFALSAIMKRDDGYAIAAIAPVSVQTEDALITIETDYPFTNSYRVRVCTKQPVTFALQVRIPGFAFDGRINGEPAGSGVIHKCWQGEEVITVTFRTKPQLRSRPEGLFCVEDGPLLFAVAPKTDWTKVEYVRNGIERKFPWCDYHITPASAWNYAFAGENFTRSERPVGAVPFSPDEPPVTLTAQMVQIPWAEENGACTRAPQSTVPLGGPVSIDLIPYGCTTLRMTEMPLIHRKEESL